MFPGQNVIKYIYIYMYCCVGNKNLFCYRLEGEQFVNELSTRIIGKWLYNVTEGTKCSNAVKNKLTSTSTRQHNKCSLHYLGYVFRLVNRS